MRSTAYQKFFEIADKKKTNIVLNFGDGIPVPDQLDLFDRKAVLPLSSAQQSLTNDMAAYHVGVGPNIVAVQSSFTLWQSKDISKLKDIAIKHDFIIIKELYLDMSCGLSDLSGQAILDETTFHAVYEFSGAEKFYRSANMLNPTALVLNPIAITSLAEIPKWNMFDEGDVLVALEKVVEEKLHSVEKTAGFITDDLEDLQQATGSRHVTFAPSYCTSSRFPQIVSGIKEEQKKPNLHELLNSGADFILAKAFKSER